MGKFMLALAMVGMVFGISCEISAREAASVAGHWELTIVAGGSTYNAEATFTQEGEQVGGTMRTDFGESKVDGTLRGATLTFTTTAGEYHLTMTGSVEGSRIENGTVDYGDGQGTWIGKRAGAENAQP